MIDKAKWPDFLPGNLLIMNFVLQEKMVCTVTLLRMSERHLKHVN